MRPQIDQVRQDLVGTARSVHVTKNKSKKNRNNNKNGLTQQQLHDKTANKTN